VDCEAVEPWPSSRGTMGVDGVVVAVLVVADLVGVFPLTKCLNVGVGSGSLKTAVSYSQCSSS
jgi:hypothetical protein